MSIKLRIRMGDVEVDYEGTEDFLKQEVPALLKTTLELQKASGGGDGASRSRDIHTGVKGDSKVPSLTTGGIAAKLKAKSGSELLLAAAGHLTLVAKKESFTRQELLKEMQTASAYYKKTYSNNFSTYLNRASTDNTLSETAANTFALSAKGRAHLGKLLADA